MAQKRSTNKAAQRKAAAEAKVTNAQETAPAKKPAKTAKPEKFQLPGAARARKADAAPENPRAKADQAKRAQQLKAEADAAKAVREAASGKAGRVRSSDEFAKSLAARIKKATSTDEVKSILTSTGGAVGGSKTPMFAQEGLYDKASYSPEQLEAIHKQAIAHYTGTITRLRNKSNLAPLTKDEIDIAVGQNRFLHENPLEYLKNNFAKPDPLFKPKPESKPEDEEGK